jgi:universal stress protein F
MFEKMLVAVDFAAPRLGERAVAFTATLTEIAAGQVRIVHVLPDLPYGLGVFLPPDFSGNLEASAHMKLREMASKADIPSARVSFAVRTGLPYHEVLAEARSWEADLVIVGSHDHSEASYLLGSNAEKIVRHAACSVLVTRAKEERAGTYWLVPPIAS